MPYCLIMFNWKYMLQYCVTLSVLLKILYTHISAKHQINLTILLLYIFLPGRIQVIDSISSSWQVDFKHFLQTEGKIQFAFLFELFLKCELEMEFGLSFVQLQWWCYLQCLLDETYFRVDVKNSVKPRHKTNLKVLLINNVVRKMGVFWWFVILQ